ncbi:hypothetical protein SPETJ133_00280 [Staphylococcus petrasii]
MKSFIFRNVNYLCLLKYFSLISEDILKYMTIFIYLNKTHAIETIEYLMLSISFKSFINELTYVIVFQLYYKYM